jgi:ribosomal protein S18 acetylase RimI-like enzyme
LVDDVELRRATTADGAAIAAVFLDSFHTTLPSIKLAHTDDECREHFSGPVVTDLETWVALSRPRARAAGERGEEFAPPDLHEDQVVGFMALGADMIDHLYVRPDCTGRGIGSQLVALAQQLRPDGMRLYTFQINTGARRFYERHGFTVVDFNDGERNEEREPDVLYEWRSEVGR